MTCPRSWSGWPCCVRPAKHNTLRSLSVPPLSVSCLARSSCVLKGSIFCGMYDLITWRGEPSARGVSRISVIPKLTGQWLLLCDAILFISVVAGIKDWAWPDREYRGYSKQCCAKRAQMLPVVGTSLLVSQDQFEYNITPPEPSNMLSLIFTMAILATANGQYPKTEQSLAFTLIANTTDTSKLGIFNDLKLAPRELTQVARAKTSASSPIHLNFSSSSTAPSKRKQPRAPQSACPRSIAGTDKVQTRMASCMDSPQ